MGINEETQLAACFMLFCTTAYSAGGDAIGAFFDEKGQGILAEHHAIENQAIDAALALIETHKNRVSIVNDAKDVYQEQIATLDHISAARTNQLKHEMRSQIVRQLELLASREAASVGRVQAKLVEAATQTVKEQFSGDKKAKKAALDGALAAL